MKHLNRLLAGALLCASVTATAQVEVSAAWVRATVAQQKATGAFMQLHSIQNARLLEVRSPLAGAVEIHQMEMVNNIMKMRQMPALDLPAGQTVELQPGGYHLMLFDLKAQIKEGDKVPITLIIETKDKKRETIEVKATVMPLNLAKQHAMQHQ